MALLVIFPCVHRGENFIKRG